MSLGVPAQQNGADASSCDSLCVSLETYVYSSDVGEDEGLPSDETVLKRCVTCKTYKPIAEFCKDASRRDGRNINCRVCRTSRRKELKEVEGDSVETVAQDEEPPQKRSRGDDLYVFKNSRLPEYKIGRSSDVAARRDALQKSQNFYIQKVTIFEGRGHLEDKVREMLAYCLLPVEVAKGREWHACSLQTALAAIGHTIDGESA